MAFSALPNATDCVNQDQVERVREMEEKMFFDYQTGEVTRLKDLTKTESDSDPDAEFENDSGQDSKTKKGSESTKLYTHHQVLKFPPDERDKYLAAGSKEFEGWYQNKAIVDVYNPKDDNAVFIDSSMKYRRKANGTAKGRACPSLRGDQMHEGTDFKKTFAPTPEAAAAKMVIALATMQKKPLYTTDNSMAFQNVDINIDPTDPSATRRLYVRPPVGYRKNVPGRIHYWSVLKAGYGIPQGPRLYSCWIVPLILSQGFKQCKLKMCLHTYRERDMSVVRQKDDHLISAWEKDAVWFREALRAKGVPSSLLETATNFNGMEIRQVADGTYISQCRFTWDILHRFEYQEVKMRLIPQRSRSNDDIDDGTLVECPVV